MSSPRIRSTTAMVAMSLLVVSCGQPGANPAGTGSDSPTGSLCQGFIDATSGLSGERDHDAYTEDLNEAARPVYDYLVGNEIQLPQQVIASWETLAHGNPDDDDLEAIHYLGGVLVPELGPACEELGRNVTPIPASLETADPAPNVELRPLYEEGTVDHACDVFIQTLFAWSDTRSGGAEIGPHIAELADGLAADLETQGISEGLEDLASYSDKYRTRPIVQAAEEAEAHLAAASQALASHSMVCAHLNTWNIHDDVNPVDLEYHRSRWEALGYDDYTARIHVTELENIRRGRDLIVVVDDGRLQEVYDIRTGDMVGPPTGVLLTIEGLFYAVEASGAGQGFHPVLGYPYGIDPVHVNGLSEGTEFDRSILGSTADVTTTVAAIDEFTPVRACGDARVPGGQPIPETQPLDGDASQAVDALAATGEEGERFVATYDYGIFERTNGILVLLGDDERGNLAFASFEREGLGWRPTSWGICRWGDAGYTRAAWALDPEEDFDSRSDEIHLIAQDECAVHTRYGNEYLVVAEFSATKVQLEVWQADEPPPSPDGLDYYNASCPMGKVVKITVNLDEPVGNRELVGATDPSEWPSDY